MQLTEDGRRLIDLAKEYAHGRGSTRLELRDVLMAICQREESAGGMARKLGMGRQELVRAVLGEPPPERADGGSRLTLSHSLRNLLATTLDKAGKGGVDTVHLMDAIAAEGKAVLDPAWGLDGALALARQVSDLEAVRSALLERVYGQDAAVNALVDGLFSCVAFDAGDDERAGPAGVFLFVGPPGVGKTYLASRAADLLGRKFLRLDMSAYSGHQQGEPLLGSSRMYKDARPGVLTSFVETNPDGLLLLDEVEKSHPNTRNLLLQILDAGTLRDAYTEQDVSFRSATVILTTNAGRQLYEKLRDASSAVLSGLSRRTVLDALGAGRPDDERDAKTGPNDEPALSGALLSRLGKGHIVLFRSLGLSDLQRVAEEGLRCNRQILESSYGIGLEWDEPVTTLLVLREGYGVDARMLRSQVDHFVREELQRAIRLAPDAAGGRLDGIRTVRIRVDDVSDEQLAPLAESPRRPRVLLLSDESVHQLMQQIEGVDWTFAGTVGETTAAIEGSDESADGDVDLILVDLFHGLEYRDGESSLEMLGHTWYGLKEVPDGARIVARGQEALRAISDKHPSAPVALLSLGGLTARLGPPRSVGSDLFVACARRFGVRQLFHSELGTSPYAARLVFASDQAAADLGRELRDGCERMRREDLAAEIQRKRKVACFSLVPQASPESGELTIQIRDLRLATSLDTVDVGRVLSSIEERPTTKLADVIGADSAKEELGDVKAYLEDPRRFLRRYPRAPRGVLLHGPPGTGKTMLARALAGETGAAFIPTVASSFVTIWQGSGPQAIRELFEAGRRYAPSIVFIDEIDSIGLERRGGPSHRAEEETLNALLAEMDGFAGRDPMRPVIVVAATNANVDADQESGRSLDPALVRRFDASVLVDLPSKKARREFLVRTLGRTKVSPETIETIADRSFGLTLADLEGIVNRAIRRSSRDVGDDDIKEALEWWVHGERRDSREPESVRRIAFHEAGHALLYWLTTQRVPAHVTAVARGGHGGYMQRSTEEMEQELMTRTQILAGMRVALGGRAAECIYAERTPGVDDGLSTGAATDLQGARRRALAFVTRYGMDEEVGIAGVRVHGEGASPTPDVLDRVAHVMRDAESEAVDLLRTNWGKLSALASALMDHGSLSGEALRTILEDDRAPES